MLEETFKWRSAYKPEEIRWVSSGLLIRGVLKHLLEDQLRGGPNLI